MVVPAPNLADLGRAAAHDRPRVGWSTPKPETLTGGEATLKDCGVGDGDAAGVELGADLAERSCGERGNHPRPPPNRTSGPGVGGKVRCRLMAMGWGGGLVVVRARERRAHGEGGQQVGREDAGMPGGRR